MFTPVPDAATQARLHDLARRRAAELRREAIDDVWRGADAAFAATLVTAQRSAVRLAHRLAHHRLARHTATLEG